MLLYTQAIADAQQKRLFEDVYTDYRGRMLTLARRKLRSPEDAEDAVHPAFLSLAEHFDRLAALLELSFAAAQKMLYRAREALRAELEKEAICP